LAGLAGALAAAAAGIAAAVVAAAVRHQSDQACLHNF